VLQQKIGVQNSLKTFASKAVGYTSSSFLDGAFTWLPRSFAPRKALPDLCAGRFPQKDSASRCSICTLALRSIRSAGTGHNLNFSLAKSIKYNMESYASVTK